MSRGYRMIAASLLGIILGFAARSLFSQPAAPEATLPDSSPSRRASRRSPHRSASAILTEIDSTQITRVIELTNSMTSSSEYRQFANQLLNDPENAESKSLWNILLARWSEIDPRDMMDFAKKQPGNELCNLAWEAWAATDPDLLATKVLSMGPPHSSAVLRGIGSRDPDLALTLCFKTPGAEIWNLMRNTEGYTPETIEALLQNAVYDGMRNPMIEHLAKSLAETTPKKALDLLNRKGRIWSDRNAQAFAQITRDDPAKAVALLKEQPISRSSAISTVQVAKNWAATDPEASLEWARSQSSAQIRDTSLVAIASVIGGEDPDRALALLTEIGWKDVGQFYSIGEIKRNGSYHDQIQEHDVVLTNRVGRALLENLAGQDPEAARQYIETQVPEDRRESLLTIFKSAEDQ